MSKAEKMIRMIVNAYVSVYGAEKWNGLTGDQQHDAVMQIARDLDREMDKAAARA